MQSLSAWIYLESLLNTFSKTFFDKAIFTLIFEILVFKGRSVLLEAFFNIFKGREIDPDLGVSLSNSYYKIEVYIKSHIYVYIRHFCLFFVLMTQDHETNCRVNIYD